jgi:AcrR family transcriptional regulator
VKGRRLPPGSHGIPADVVARNQRERLIAAMAEVCGEEGYVAVSVEKVAKRAGVSSATFYKQFADKRDCMLSAHRQLLERLLAEVDRARETESGEEAKVRATIRTALALLAADAPSARLLTVEILAAGPEGAALHDAMVESFARRLRADVDPSTPLPTAAWVWSAGALALVGRMVVAGEAERLPELEHELVATIGL